MSSKRFKLGTFFGISLYVHWTFALLIAYVVYTTWASGAVPAMIAFSVAQVLTVFLCVTLHEYGHALSARRYDVGTLDITLLPIGGVARLKRIPQVPWQEFVIAVAGPAVNVVIAGLLVMSIIAAGGGWLFEALYQLFWGTMPAESQQVMGEQVSRVLEDPSLLGFAFSILLINVMLVLFNMIPAFPMDGGRVLRSLLAMAMPYVPATRWAQRIGLVCAILMAAFALSSDPPRIIMVLIAAFIVYAGLAEARQVEVRELVEGLRVADVMSHSAPLVRAEMTVDDLQAWWQTHNSASAAVVGINGILLGHLRLSDLVTHLETQVAAAGVKSRSTAVPETPSPALPSPLAASGERLAAAPYAPRDASQAAKQERPLWNVTALDLADPKAEPLETHQGLEGLLSGGRQQQREFAVIDQSGRLVGWLDLDTLRERAALAKMLNAAVSSDRSSPPANWSLDHSA